MNAGNSKSTLLRVAVPVTVCVSVFALAVICYVNWPRNTIAGEIIEQYGTFRSPHGNGVVVVKPVNSGQSSVTVSANTPTRSPSGTMLFPSTKAWFGAWDDREHFWIYVDGLGVHVLDEVHGTSSSTQAGESGGWEGIPAEFLGRLPEAEIHKYELSLVR